MMAGMNDTQEHLMDAVLEGLPGCALDYEIIESYESAGDNIAWIEVEGRKFSIIVKERE